MIFVAFTKKTAIYPFLRVHRKLEKNEMRSLHGYSVLLFLLWTKERERSPKCFARIYEPCRKLVKSLSLKNVYTLCIHDSRNSSLCIHEKELNSLRTGLFSRVPQIHKKGHCVYCLFENSRKKWIVTDCYSKIVTKDHQKPLSLLLRANHIFADV